MEKLFQTQTIVDQHNRKGIVLKKENKYWKAWFHESEERWDPLIYGEEGQNLDKWIFDDENIEFVIIKILKYGDFLLEMKDFRKFYNENLNIKSEMFGSIRFLFPLSLCKKIK